MTKRTYLAIDLKSYYASVECVDRTLDPLTTNLVVADESRTEKTICLAVSPSLKAYGISGRARLFEVVQRVKEVNAERLKRAPGHRFTGKSSNALELANDPSLELSYIIAPPRMRTYMEKSANIYNIYLKYVSAEDIHVYSIDECFLDVTDYLSLYNLSAHDLCMKLIQEVLHTTGITATGGIGTNMYLAKIAMDVEAKHVAPDQDGVRIAELTERSYREKLWAHEPLTDFWRVGQGTVNRLAEHHIHTMGDIARCSIGLPPADFGPDENLEFGPDGRALHPDAHYNEALLYKLFGINAELLIDHAWGYESAKIHQIKDYKPETNSISSGQVLPCPYSYEKVHVIIKEMTDLLVLDLVDKGLMTDQIIWDIGYDIDNTGFKGEMHADRYGRKVPKPAHGSINLGKYSSSTVLIMEKSMQLFEQITDPRLYVRRLSITAAHVIPEEDVKDETAFEQLNLFVDYEALEKEREEQKQKDAKEKNLQKAILDLQKKFGKNTVLRGTNFEEGATTIERNGTVGGHKG